MKPNRFSILTIGALVAFLTFAPSASFATSSCPKATRCLPFILQLVPECSPDFKTTSAWRVINPNTQAVTYSWTINGTEPLIAGSRTVAAQGQDTFTTTATGSKTVTIWVNSFADSTQSTLPQCDCNKVPGGSAVIDDCGTCAGLNSAKGCDGVCSSGKVVDACGICGGDGKCLTEECTVQSASVTEKKRAKKVLAAARILRDRTKKFADGGLACHGPDNTALITKANDLFRQISDVLATKITNSVLVCSNSVCGKATTDSVKKQLETLTKRLYKLAKKSKLSAVKACADTGTNTGPKRKVTEDYRDDTLNAIKGLPGSKTQCQKS